MKTYLINKLSFLFFTFLFFWSPNVLFSQTPSINQTSEINLKNMNSDQIEDFIIHNYNFSKILKDLNVDPKYHDEWRSNYRLLVYKYIHGFYNSIKSGVKNQNDFNSAIVAEMYKHFVDSTSTLVGVDRVHDTIIPPPVLKSSACNNVDFENGTMVGWQMTNGNIPGGVPYSFTATGAGAAGPNFLITSAASGNDPICGIPMKYPGSGSYSCRLGNGASANGTGARIKRAFMVTPANSIFSFAYAVVLQDPGHPVDQQPYFQFKVLDAYGNNIPCFEYAVSANENIPGFQSLGDVRYKDWSTVMANLTPYIGQIISIEFTAGDCSLGGHYGYAYIDANCALPEISVSNSSNQICVDDSITLSVVSGYGTTDMSVLWNTGDTTESINVNNPGTYTVLLTPPSGIASCAFQLQKTLNFTAVDVTAKYVTDTVCMGSPNNFIDQSFVTPADSDNIVSYVWDFGDGSPAATTANPNHIYTNSGFFNTSLIVSTAHGCKDTVNFVAGVKSSPIGTMTGMNVCQGDSSSITFTGTNGTAPYIFTYKDENNVTQNLTSDATGVAMVNVPTNVADTLSYYLVSVTDNGVVGCPNLLGDTLNVIITPTPNASIAGDTTICKGLSSPIVTITGTGGITPYEFTYKDPSGNIQTIQSNNAGVATINVPSNNAGTFTYTLLSVKSGSALACTKQITDSVKVTINPIPTATIQGSIDICQNSTSPTITFQGNNGTAPYTFTYIDPNGSTNTSTSNSSGIDTISVSSATPGTFVYVLKSIQDASITTCSMTYNDSVKITVNPLPTATLTHDVSFCQFVDDSILTLNGSEGVPPYTFYYTDPYGNQQSLTSDQSGITTFHPLTDTAGAFVYNLTGVRDASKTQCYNAVSQAVNVTVFKMPIADFDVSPQEMLSDMTKVELSNNSKYAGYYLWSFGDDSTSTDTNPNHTYPDGVAGIYTITLVAISPNGMCFDTIVKAVRVTDDAIYYVPNTFTPNGDEHNNTFRPFFTKAFDINDYTLQIYDRWGEIVYVSHNVDAGWDGTYKGEICKEGTYVWKIDIRMVADGERKTFIGHLNLLK